MKKKKFRSLKEATPEEMREATRIASLWLTAELEGRTTKGAFSERNLGEAARKFFVKRAIIVLLAPDCKWKWKEGTKLSTLMINVMRSEMGHVLRKYINQGKPEMVMASDLDAPKGPAGGEDESDSPNGVLEIDEDVRRNAFEMRSEMELLEELEREEGLREKGMRIARAAVKGNARLEKYVELVFELPDYRAISKRMKVTLTEVKAMEMEVIKNVNKYGSNRENG